MAWNTCGCSFSKDKWCDCCNICDIPIIFTIIPQENPPGVCFITVNGLEALRPYDYQLDGGTIRSGVIIPNLNGSVDLTNLNCGLFHSLQLQLGCRYGTEEFFTFLEQCENIDINFTAQIEYQCDTTNNVIVAGTAGGNPPYEYSLDGQNWQNQNQFTNLPEGIYQIYVRDQDGCIGGPLQVEVVQPPEFKGLGWLSQDGDDKTGANNNVFVYSCLGNSNYLIKTSANDPAYFDFTATYESYFPLLSGQDYEVEIVAPGIAGNNPRIYAEENGVIIFDTGFGASPGTYTFTYTHDLGDDVRIWFDKSGGGIATFQLVTFNITQL